MRQVCIENVKIIDKPGQAVLVKDGLIQAVGDQATLACPPEAAILDGQGATLAPGFIEMQINGGFGMDFTEQPESIWQVGNLLPRFGVTTFLPTIVTSPLETVARAMQAITGGRPEGFRGAEALGLHLEGPFLSLRKKGAHNPRHLRLPSIEQVKDWSPANGVRLVTLAPELPGALETIAYLSKQGVLVSMGHSMANQKEAEAGIAAGARWGTHLFNAMPGLDHHEANLTAVLMTDERIGFGIIADGVHVDPLMVKLAWRARGGRGIVLVTDALAPLGMPKGPSHMAGVDLIVDEVSAHLVDGTLAGSTMPQNAALRNLMRFSGCSLAEGLATLTAAPAALLGLADRGRIQPGLRADLVLLDENIQVSATLVAGEIVYRRGDERAD